MRTQGHILILNHNQHVVPLLRCAPGPWVHLPARRTLAALAL